MKAKQIQRERFRDEVFKRDGYKCRVCRKAKPLDAHHIINRNLMPHGGYVKENGISLCEDCHWLAENYTPNMGQDAWDPFHLFKLIGSSTELALEKSRRLE